MTTPPITRPQLSVAARLVQLIESWPDTPDAAQRDPHQQAAAEHQPDAAQAVPHATSTNDERPY